MAGRPDARAKARGRARYTQDLYPRRVLHGAVVRSPHAAARLLAVDLGPARVAEGVVAVLGPDDVPDRRFGIVERDERVLARDVVRYVGEPVALVAAETPEAAQRAAALVDVRYEPLPAATTLDAALAAGAPAVRDGTSNVMEPSVAARGDTDAAFAAAAHVVSTTVRSHRAHQGYIELRSALAEVDRDGRLVVHITSQAPFQVRQALAQVFDLPMTRVVVRVPAFGGGFGGKLHNGMALYATALCLATGRPVQVVSSRAEEMQASNPREGSIVTIESALDDDGLLLGRRVRGYFDSGALTYDTPFITSMGAMQSCGPYSIPAVDARIHAVATNVHPTGSFRAPSAPQMCFANEVHMDDIAEQLGLDRVELRRRNIMRPGALGPTGQTVENPAMATCLDEVVATLDEWRAEAMPPEDGRRRGFGLACAWWFTSPGLSAANVRMNEDGSVTVYSGATEIGTGAVVSGLPQLVADELGLEPDAVSLVTADTEAAPADLGSEGSRTLYGAGSAVLRATVQVREILAEAVADELEASKEDVVFSGGRVHVAGSPGRALPIAEAVEAATRRGGPPVGSGRFEAPPVSIMDGCAGNMRISSFNEPTFHCHGVEVEIDPELGAVRVVRYVAAHDTGPWIATGGVRGQIEGGIVQGIGYALYEEMLIGDDGRTRNADLVDYRLPTIADVPDEICIIPVEGFPGTNGPRGAKGIGEAPIILPAAAIGSAIRDAVGARITDLPLRPDRVVAGIPERAPS
jgi:CO/xanthine dehydrogenase Mo-binding subunit